MNEKHDCLNNFLQFYYYYIVYSWKVLMFRWTYIVALNISLSINPRNVSVHKFMQIHLNKKCKRFIKMSLFPFISTKHTLKLNKMSTVEVLLIYTVQCNRKMFNCCKEENICTPQKNHKWSEKDTNKCENSYVLWSLRQMRWL